MEIFVKSRGFQDDYCWLNQAGSRVEMQLDQWLNEASDAPECYFWREQMTCRILLTHIAGSRTDRFGRRIRSYWVFQTAHTAEYAILQHVIRLYLLDSPSLFAHLNQCLMAQENSPGFALRWQNLPHQKVVDTMPNAVELPMANDQQKFITRDTLAHRTQLAQNLPCLFNLNQPEISLFIGDSSLLDEPQNLTPHYCLCCSETSKTWRLREVAQSEKKSATRYQTLLWILLVLWVNSLG